MRIIKILLLCNYTSGETRHNLSLSDLKLDNYIRSIMKLPKLQYIDAAPWSKSIISYFASNQKTELHLAALQQGMRKEYETFQIRTVHYHYIKSGLNFFDKILNKLFGIQKKHGFPIYRKRFEKALADLKPDLAIICGAENPDYANFFINFNCEKKLVIMQTLMNDPKRIEMGISSDYRCYVEKEVIKSCNYIAVPDKEWKSFVKQQNPVASIYDFVFPTVEPIVSHKCNKEYDFVFFAGVLGKYKGTDDLIKAMCILTKTHPFTTLNIIGSADEKYSLYIHNFIKNNGLENNIKLIPSFKNRNDVFNEISKANNVVLPSITASLNSTVRESMLMGLPTIVYKTWATSEINSCSQCLLEAEMENVADLSKQMAFAIDNPEIMKVFGLRGINYANSHYTQSAFNNMFYNILNKMIE